MRQRHALAGSAIIYGIFYAFRIGRVFAASECPAPKINLNTLHTVDADRIIGGVKVNVTEIPYQLSLQIKEGHNGANCGAVLIKPSYALTAAHCFQDRGPETTFILTAGNFYLDQVDDHEQVREGSKIWIHKNFGEDTFFNDITVLQVKKPFLFNAYAQPIVLPTKDFEPEGSVTVSGWGCTDRDCANRLSSVLKKVTVPIVPLSMCKKLYGPEKVLNTMICAGYVENGMEDSCRGDSGGPLVAKNSQDVDVLVGIVSFGESCACPGYPGVYTRVTSYLQWIDDVLQGRVKPTVLTSSGISFKNSNALVLTIFLLLTLVV